MCTKFTQLIIDNRNLTNYTAATSATSTTFTASLSAACTSLASNSFGGTIGSGRRKEGMKGGREASPGKEIDSVRHRVLDGKAFEYKVAVSLR